MTDEQYRRIRSAIKADAVDRAHDDILMAHTADSAFDKSLDTLLFADGDLGALEAAYELVIKSREVEELESMKRIVEMVDDVSLIAAQLDADAGTVFRATEPPDDAEADGTND